MLKHILTKKKTICILSGILLILIVWTAWGNTALELNTYTISSRELPDAFDGYRIAQVSDLHNAEFGGGNQRLLDMLREAEPDMIAITGDLIDSRKTNRYNRQYCKDNFCNKIFRPQALHKEHYEE